VALTAFNLLHCEAHREALTTIARLSAEERLRPVEPEAGMLADLMDRLKAFAHPAATAD